MSDGLLVINAGSSSIKFSVYVTDGNDLDLRSTGQLEGLGVGITPHFRAKDAGGTVIADDHWPPVEVGRQSALLGRLIDWIEDHLGDASIRAAGHRVVHGGSDYSAPVLVTKTVLDDLRSLTSLAPLHQPHNLAPIAALAELHPDLPQVVCFDTAFHAHKRLEAEMFGLPRKYYEAGIKRYGFHGLSYEYILHALSGLDPQAAGGRVIVAHLGSGVSMCAIKDGRSVDTSIGFTAVDGLLMGTRCGSLDAGVVLHLMQQEGLDAKALEKLFYKESGLLGVSGGLSNDMRVLLASDAVEAKQAVDLFVYRVAKEVGALATAIGGVDALVFTAGIGERSPDVRQRVCEQIGWTGARLDIDANTGNHPRVSSPDSAYSIWAIPTNEELMIARHTRKLVLG